MGAPEDRFTPRLSRDEHMALARFLAGGLPAGQLDDTLARAREEALARRVGNSPAARARQQPRQRLLGPLNGLRT